MTIAVTFLSVTLTFSEMGPLPLAFFVSLCLSPALANVYRQNSIFSHDLMETLSTFCYPNGHKFLAISTPNDQMFRKWPAKFKSWAQISKLTWVHWTQLQSNLTLSDTLVVFLPNLKQIQETLAIFNTRPIQKSILVLPEPYFDPFKSTLTQFKLNSLFVLLTIDPFGNFLYRQILTLNHSEQVLISPIHFEHNGQMKELQDLQGLSIEATGKDWKPYITVSENTTEPFGFLVDIMQVWSKRYNFTWQIVP